MAIICHGALAFLYGNCLRLRLKHFLIGIAGHRRQLLQVRQLPPPRQLALPQ